MPKIALQVRLDENTHQKLKKISENELRSLNAQLEYFVIQGIKSYESSHGDITLSDPE